MKLSDMACEACRAGAPQLTDQQLAEGLAQLTDWQCQTLDGIKQLQRSFRFANFIQALDFTNQVAALAEQHNHHPLIQLEYGRVEVRWWTHKINGLHQNDLVLAAKTEQLFTSN